MHFPLSAKLLLTITSVALLSSAHAEPIKNSMVTPKAKLELEISEGFGQGKLDWNIAEINGTPNVLSELVYELDAIWITRLHSRLNVVKGQGKNFFIDLQGYWGSISDGSSTDKDWDSNNRQDLFSLSHSDTTGESINQLEVGIGYRFQPTTFISLSPMAGYHYSEQNIRVKNGVQDFSTKGVTLGPFSNSLNTTYETQWEGYFLGAEASLKTDAGVDFLLSLNYQKTNYLAEANWNLRADFQHPVSFRHETDKAQGWSVSNQVAMHPHPRVKLFLQLDYQHLNSGSGTDSLFFTSGSTAVSPLNEANWESTSIALGVGWRY